MATTIVVPAQRNEQSAFRPSRTPADAILDAFADGNAAQLASGRSLYDLVSTAGGKLVTVQEDLLRRARAAHGLATVTYSLANGLDWNAARITDQRDRRVIEDALRSQNLLDLSRDDHEMVRVVRGVSSLVRATPGNLVWSDGTPLRFLFLIEFAEHLVPCGRETSRTDAELTVVELAHILGQSNALRVSGNLVVLYGREELVDRLVAGVLHPVRLAQPGEQDKRDFLAAARALYPNARFEDGVTDEDVARLTANTPNRGLEAQMRNSHRRAVTVSVDELTAQKGADVVSLSEGTLTTLDTRRVNGVALVGRSVRVPLLLLEQFGEGLLRGDADIPANVILVGPPGTGKTDLALMAAARARASVYQVHSPKAGIVGETERRSRILTTALAQWTPNVSFIDEITEAFPLERTEFNGDSGASSAVTAALLTMLSDESRRGRSLLLATTNCPWRMGAAMRSRFTMIPVLSPVSADYPAIVTALARRVSPNCAIDEAGAQGAADLFFSKGASPREIRSALGGALFHDGELTPSTVLGAARDLRPSCDRLSVEYADLWAVKACSSMRYLPWHNHAGDYPFPAHLVELVDPSSGEIDVYALERRLEALSSHARV